MILTQNRPHSLKIFCIPLLEIEILKGGWGRKNRKKGGLLISFRIIMGKEEWMSQYIKRMNKNYKPAVITFDKNIKEVSNSEEKWKAAASLFAEKREEYRQKTAEMTVINKKKEKIKKAWKISPDLIKWSSCILYYRRSTNKQDTTIESQQKECIKKANDLNLRIRREYYEEVSGKTDAEEREEMTKMLEEIRPGEVLIVYSVSRIARQPDVFYTIMRRLKDMGCRVVCCHENLDSIDPHTEMLWAVHVSFAQQERLAISSRTSAALQTMKAKGLAIHRPRWGQRIDPDTKKFVPIPEIQEFIQDMINLRKNGWTLMDIARSNNDLNFPTPGGRNKWDSKTVSSVLKREMTKEEYQKYNKRRGFEKNQEPELDDNFSEEEKEENVENEETEIEQSENTMTEEETEPEPIDVYESLSLPMLRLKIMRRKEEFGISDQDITSMTRHEIIFTLRNT